MSKGSLVPMNFSSYEFLVSLSKNVALEESSKFPKYFLSCRKMEFAHNLNNLPRMYYPKEIYMHNIYKIISFSFTYFSQP